MPNLDSLDHVAIPVEDVASSVDWYTRTFQCEVKYQDETWALLGFENVNVALVIPSQHPAHIAFSSPEAARFGELKTHRDGTRSCYVKDPTGNAVEIMAEVAPK
jgi:catechol 2,3-dioxygenase-like lactoylglutathione lyase family enzyme